MKLKIVAIQTSKIMVSFETVAFRFKIFIKELKHECIDRMITFLLEESRGNEENFCNKNWFLAQIEYQI